MSILYFDCFAGVSGDMTLGALLDLGVSEEYLASELKKLNLDGWRIAVSRVQKNGVSANHVNVILEEEHHHHHEHEEKHEHTHGQEHAHKHEHTHGRNFADIRAMIENSAITDNAKALAIAIFQRVADAEGRVHGKPADEVHFHEVGAVDSIIDIVGCAICVDYLKPTAIYASTISDGKGFTYCQHGMIPIPVPAVMEIFKNRNVPFKQLDIEKELTTPTGAAIVAELANDFVPMDFTVTAIGCGAGTRDLKIPNVLRVMLCKEQADESGDTVTILETNLDDEKPEILGYTMERLLEAGALDVFYTPIYMKKNRPAVKLTVIAKPTDVAAFEEIIFTETATIGIRRRTETRTVLAREAVTVDTPYGTIRAKRSIFNNYSKTKPEFEDAKALAREKGIPLRDLLD